MSENHSYGEVLIDGLTLENSSRIFNELRKENRHNIQWHDLKWSDTAWLANGELTVISFASLIECLVLYDKLYIDAKSHETGTVRGNLKNIDNRFSDVIGYILSTKDDRTEAYYFAKDVSTSTNLDELCKKPRSLYPTTKNFELGTTSGYWLDEAHIEIGGFDEYPLLLQEVQKKYPKSSRETGSNVGLADCAIRAWYYAGLARKKNIMYVPNDFRALFIDPLGLARSSAERILAKLEGGYDRMLNFNAEWYGEAIPKTNLRLPLIFTSLLSKASTPSKIIELAFDMRNSKDAVKFREKCRELDRTRTEDPHTINRKLREMGNELQKIEKQLGLISSDQISVSASVTYGISIGTTLKPFLDFLKGGQKHLTFLRDIFKHTS